MIHLVGLPRHSDVELVAHCLECLALTATSPRLTNREAAEPTSGLSPGVMRCSMPHRYASAAATYCARENRSVTLIGKRAKIAFSMAGRPSSVPGILMKRLGRAARA